MKTIDYILLITSAILIVVAAVFFNGTIWVFVLGFPALIITLYVLLRWNKSEDIRLEGEKQKAIKIMEKIKIEDDVKLVNDYISLPYESFTRSIIEIELAARYSKQIIDSRVDEFKNSSKNN